MKIALQLFINTKYFILSIFSWQTCMYPNKPVFLRNYFTSIKTEEQTIQNCIGILEPVQATTSQGFSRTCLSKAHFSPFTHSYNMFYNQLKYYIKKKKIFLLTQSTLPCSLCQTGTREVQEPRVAQDDHHLREGSSFIWVQVTVSCNGVKVLTVLLILRQMDLT